MNQFLPHNGTAAQSLTTSGGDSQCGCPLPWVWWEG